jgi:hypothetical protein
MRICTSNDLPIYWFIGPPNLTTCNALVQGTSMPADDLDSFIKEAALTRKLKHKYIVDYVGVGKLQHTVGYVSAVKHKYTVGLYCK